MAHYFTNAPYLYYLYYLLFNQTSYQIHLKFKKNSCCIQGNQKNDMPPALKIICIESGNTFFLNSKEAFFQD